MNKKRIKGFTLIELLAVIVILAIILLIAMPVVLNTINNAKKGAFGSSAYGIIKAVENDCLRKQLKNDPTETIINIENSNIITGNLEITGKLPNEGTIIVDNACSVEMAINDGQFCIIKQRTDKKISPILYDGDCSLNTIEFLGCTFSISLPFDHRDTIMNEFAEMARQNKQTSSPLASIAQVDSILLNNGETTLDSSAMDWGHSWLMTLGTQIKYYNNFNSVEAEDECLIMSNHFTPGITCENLNNREILFIIFNNGVNHVANIIYDNQDDSLFCDSGYWNVF